MYKRGIRLFIQIQLNLMLAKFAFWLNDNLANQDVLKNPVP